MEVDEVGQVVHPRPRQRLVLGQARATGSSIGLVPQICEWQVMHVWVGGSPANDEVSTDVWQYRQSIPSPRT